MLTKIHNQGLCGYALIVGHSNSQLTVWFATKLVVPVVVVVDKNAFPSWEVCSARPRRGQNESVIDVQETGEATTKKRRQSTVPQPQTCPPWSAACAQQPGPRGAARRCEARAGSALNAAWRTPMKGCGAGGGRGSRERRGGEEGEEGRETRELKTPRVTNRPD